ncbi:protein PSK SIMULATOR 3 [Sesamum alatum]|uniref:Protein PSK SIMULATOR 3 n=1 Tax=Sesamum alatum TaxID=300844 RepID=A0AAE2CC20_9LAMI|nr:protein PSK SIMULATOR 3 [Sesamum alatum]
MGALCSKQTQKPNPYAGRSTGYQQRQQVQNDTSNVVMTRQESVEKQMLGKESPRLSVEKQMVAKESPRLLARYENVSDDEFYDGIPQYHRSSYQKSRSLRGNKVSEVGSLLSRAGSAGLERAAEVLDTLGTTVTGGFISGATTKNTELSILAFEVANTIVKGSNLMQSLSKRSIRQLKEVVLLAEGVQQLISKDMDELLRIVAADKREELKIFSGEVVRFGNRCKDPQWHNLDRFFEKRSRDRTPQKQLRETAESVMEQLMTSVQLTAELYQDLHVLDRLEQDYQLKRLEVLRFNAGQRGDRDNRLNILAAELKNQRKLVKNLKKKSLWSRSMEEVMEKLVDIVLFLNQEINITFGSPAEGDKPEEQIVLRQQKLGPAGLSLHYANIILQIDAIVARSSSMPSNSRETLYQSLPPNVKDSLRSKLQSFHVEKELSVTEIKDEMEKTLHWLVPVATNTAKAHHGFGWVGEWASTGSELNRRTVGPIDVMQIETLHHANKQKTEAHILDMLLWLNYLVSRSKASAKAGGPVMPSIRSPIRPSKNAADQQPITNDTLSTPSHADQASLQSVNCKSEGQETINACNSGPEESNAAKLDSNELGAVEARSSGNTFARLGLDGEKSLDVIDRV